MSVQGYVYAWKVPIAIEVDGEEFDDLCLIKIGKSESNSLWERLYPQRLSWGKLLGTQAMSGTVKKMKTVGSNQFPYIDMNTLPSIPYCNDKFDSEEAQSYGDSVFSEMREEGEYSDLAFFLLRNAGHHLDDDERFIRALFGLSARTSFVDI